MTYWFGDGFDCYSAITDCGTYWDATFGGSATLGLSATGRFAGSRGLTAISGSNAIAYITKTSAVNDAVHHISVSVQSGALTGTLNGIWFALYDGTNAQCSVAFRTDGAILLYSGMPSGTAIATYTGAMAAINTWYQFEIEVVINNTTGSISVRKNGNTSNDFTLGSLNTRAGSTNNYANKIGAGAGNTGGSQIIDDLLWRSDLATVPWIGDVRCWTRMPATDASVAWARSGAGSLSQSLSTGASTVGISNTAIRFQAYTIQYPGVISSVTAVTANSASGNLKCAIWSDIAGVPGAVLATAVSPVVTVAAGNNIFTFSPALSVTVGQRIWIGVLCDTSAGNWSVDNTTSPNGGTASGSYATFPQANPVTTTPSVQLRSVITFTLPNTNAALVQDPQQDGATSYVYSSTVSQSDLYGIAAIGSTPSTIVGVTTRAYAQKSDAGTRNIAVQLQSGATNVQSASTALNAGSWNWVSRTDLVDPATGSAWTATGVNNALVGQVVTA